MRGGGGGGGGDDDDDTTSVTLLLAVGVLCLRWCRDFCVVGGQGCLGGGDQKS